MLNWGVELVNLFSKKKTAFLKQSFLIKFEVFPLHIYVVCIITSVLDPKIVLLKHFGSCYQIKYFSEHFSVLDFQIVTLTCIKMLLQKCISAHFITEGGVFFDKYLLKRACL